MRSFAIAAAVSTLASFAVAQNNTGSGNTVDLFIDDDINSQGLYAASIVSACNDQTVYALQCTSARGDVVGSRTCGAAAPTLTVTGGPSVYMVNYVTETSAFGHDAELTISESCALTGTTEANCVVSVAIEVDDTSTATSTSMVLSGTDYHRYQVAITGGAEKTASATGACKPNAGAETNPDVVRVVGAALAIGLMGVLAL
ncbi:hypothetical protein C8A03DRAFT_13685 [Achaetomium macrosporum]|uniref:Uncharacterized protein n=1 Tax=Achaetomium macrosporum TaxID=79813 RepID=A0AAN7CDC8_9PEZI|nr:hypothetical protein C8A03DRAFT_13685 [Achaetomium macrosporum]